MALSDYPSFGLSDSPNNLSRTSDSGFSNDLSFGPRNPPHPANYPTASNDILSPEDYSQIAAATGCSDVVVRSRFVQNQLQEFRVADLKNIIKHLKTKYPSNPFFRQSGAKPSLLQSLTQGLDFVSNNISNRSTAPSRPAYSDSSHPANPSFQTSPDMYRRPPAQQYPPAAPPRPYQPPHPIAQPFHVPHGHHANTTPFPFHNSQASSSNKLSHVFSHPRFASGRSPYIACEEILAWKTVIPRQRISLAFNLNGTRIIQAQRKVDRGENEDRGPTHAVHLRLFQTEQFLHSNFDQFFKVTVNKSPLVIDARPRTAGIKHKGVEMARALDISAYVSDSNLVDIQYVPSVGSDAAPPFNGIAFVEYVRLRTTAELQNTIKVNQAKREEEAKIRAAALAAGERKCGDCGSTQGLMRCSRCKSEWYCSQAHQSRHWGEHQKTCRPHAEPPPTPTIGVKREVPADDDEIMVSAAKVSLNCPLSIIRIKIPAKGEKCQHPQCFDLNAFLNFCEQSCVWQCPTCFNPLPFDELRINLQMAKVLSQVNENVTQVRLNEDGSFTAEEPEETESASSDDEDGPSTKKRLKRSASSSSTNAEAKDRRPVDVVALDSDDDDCPPTPRRQPSAPSAHPSAASTLLSAPSASAHSSVSTPNPFPAHRQTAAPGVAFNGPFQSSAAPLPATLPAASALPGSLDTQPPFTELPFESDLGTFAENGLFRAGTPVNYDDFGILDPLAPDQLSAVPDIPDLPLPSTPSAPPAPSSTVTPRPASTQNGTGGPPSSGATNPSAAPRSSSRASSDVIVLD